MKINNYKDLEEYKRHLEKKKNVSEALLTRQLDKKKNRLQSMVKWASVPVVTTLVGSMVYKWTNSNGEDAQGSTAPSNGGRHKSEMVRDILQIAKVLLPVLTALWAKEQTVEHNN